VDDGGDGGRDGSDEAFEAAGDGAGALVGVEVYHFHAGGGESVDAEGDIPFCPGDGGEEEGVGGADGGEGVEEGGREVDEMANEGADELTFRGDVEDMGDEGEEGGEARVAGRLIKDTVRGEDEGGEAGAGIFGGKLNELVEETEDIEGAVDGDEDVRVGTNEKSEGGGGPGGLRDGEASGGENAVEMTGILGSDDEDALHGEEWQGGGFNF